MCVTDKKPAAWFEEMDGVKVGEENKVTDLVAVQLVLANAFDGYFLTGPPVQGFVDVGESTASWNRGWKVCESDRVSLNSQPNTHSPIFSRRTK